WGAAGGCWCGAGEDGGRRRLAASRWCVVVVTVWKFCRAPSWLGSGNRFSNDRDAALRREPGIWLFANGAPVAGSTIVRPSDDRSPARSAAVGTVEYASNGLLE